METGELNESENQKNGGTTSQPTVATASDKQKKLSIPAVVVRNENNDIIEQMDEPSMDISQTIRRNLKSKLIQRANSPVKEQTEKIQEALASENSESGSEEGLSDSSDTETTTEQRKDGESVGKAVEGSESVGAKGKELEAEQGQKEQTSVCQVKESKQLEAATVTEQGQEQGKSVHQVKEGGTSKEDENLDDQKEDQKIEIEKNDDTDREGEKSISAIKEDESISKSKEEEEIEAATEKGIEKEKYSNRSVADQELKSSTSSNQENVKGREGKTGTLVESEAPVLEDNVISNNMEVSKEQVKEKEVLECSATETNQELDKIRPSEDDITRGKENRVEQEFSKKDMEKKTTVEMIAEEENDKIENEHGTETNTSSSNKNSTEESGKLSVQHSDTKIASKEAESEKGMVVEEEADNEKDFSQFIITKTTSTSSTSTASLPPPPLMIPALGLAVNPASIPAVGQFPRGAVDLNTVAMQQFQQFNIQPSAESSCPPLTRVIYTPAVASAFPAGVSIQPPQNRFPSPTQAINVIHGSQVPQGSPNIITGLPVGIVPIMQSSNIRPAVHHQRSGVPQTSTLAQKVPPVLPISSSPQPTPRQAIHRTLQSPSSTGASPHDSSGQAAQVSLVPLISTSPLIQPGLTVNRSLAASQIVSTTIAPHVILATQAQVRQTGPPASTTNQQVRQTGPPASTTKQPSQTSIPPPRQSKPNPVQQTADASTYVDNDTVDVTRVNKVKMFYFQCDKCTFVTKSAQNFRRHCMLHLSYKPYACSSCGFSSCNKYGFSSHLKNHQECAGQKFVYKKDFEAERQLERNVNECKRHKWVSDEENDKSSKELFGDQRRFRFTAKKSEPGNPVLNSGISGETTDDSSPDVQLGVVKKTYSGKKKIRDILGEMENNSRKQVENSSNSANMGDAKKVEQTNKNISLSDVAETNNDDSVSREGEKPLLGGSELPGKIVSQENGSDTDEMSDVIEPLPTGKNNSRSRGDRSPKYKEKAERLSQKKQNGTMKTSAYLKKNFQKAKKIILQNKKKLKRRRNQATKVQNYEIVDESNILDLPRVRKFKTTFDPSPALYKRRKKELFEEEEFQRPSKVPTPPKSETKESAVYYKCPYCDHSGDTAVGIKRHAFWVHNMCEYTCNLCMYMSMSKQECLKHCYADHPGTSPCIKRSFCKTMEVEEINDNRGDEKDDKSDDKDDDEKENDEDESTDSASEGKESSDESRQQRAKYPIKSQQNVRCVKCDMKLSRKGMQFHLLRMHKVFMYKCSHCKFASKNIDQVNSHCTSKHDSRTCKPVRITYDLDLGHDLIEFIPNQKSKQMKKSKFSRVLKYKTNFKRKVRPLSMKANCPLCGFASNYIGVQRHISMRHKLKKLQCGRCGHVTYNKADALKHSVKVHKEETPYVLRTFADIESVEAMSKEELKKCGVVIFKRKEVPSFDAENKGSYRDIDAKSNDKVPTSVATPEKDKGKENWVSCPVCFAEKRTLRGVELHMMFLHKICNWLCGKCGFQSTDKYVTLQHSVDLHKDEDPIISRTLVNLDKYLTEQNMGLDYRPAKTKQLPTKADPYKPDFDDNESTDGYLNLETQKDPDETSHVSRLDPEFNRNRKAPKRRSCSPKGSDYSSVVSAGSDKITPKKSPRDSPRIPDRESEHSDSSEDDTILKKKRNKRSLVVARASPSVGYTPSSFVVRPKDMNQLNQGFSCVYCNYAAPLRHQVRLHCYDKHTNHPACVMEFQLDGEEKFYRNDGTEETVSDSPEDSDRESKTKTAKRKGDNSVPGDKYPVSGSEPKTMTSNCDEDSKKEDGSVDSNKRRSESLTSGGTDTDELVSSEIIDNSGKRFRRGRKRKMRFDNPLKMLVHKLNSSRINLEDTFHGSLDEVDSFLNKFGVRTLNMDMLTQQQFSDFIERFGSCLQPV